MKSYWFAYRNSLLALFFARFAETQYLCDTRVQSCEVKIKKKKKKKKKPLTLVRYKHEVV